MMMFRTLYELYLEDAYSLYRWWCFMRFCRNSDEWSDREAKARIRWANALVAAKKEEDKHGW